MPRGHASIVPIPARDTVSSRTFAGALTWCFRSGTRTPQPTKRRFAAASETVGVPLGDNLTVE